MPSILCFARNPQHKQERRISRFGKRLVSLVLALLLLLSFSPGFLPLRLNAAPVDATVYGVGSTLSISGDTNLNAVCEAKAVYTLTYDGNSSTGGTTPVDDKVYMSGSIVVVLGNTGNLERTGYTFDGWNTAANGSGKAYNANDTFTIDANVTLYAQWTVNSYTVTVNESYTSITGAGTYQYGETVTINAGTYSVFLYLDSFEWTVTSGGVTLADSKSATTTFVMLANDVVVTAVWSLIIVDKFPSYVKYIDNGSTSGIAPIDDKEYASGATAVVLGNIGNLERTGYTFDGWNTAANGSGKAYNANDTFTIDANVTLYAQWTVNSHTVTVNESYRSTTGAGTYQYGEPLTIYAGTRSGYTFSEWTVTAGGVTLADFNCVITNFVMPANDVVVTANWTQIEREPEQPLDTDYWALFNLILCILGCVLALGCITRFFFWRGKKERKSGFEEKKAKTFWLVMVILFAIAGVVVFFLTEDMKLTIRWVDVWTIANLIIFCVVVACATLIFRKTKRNTR